jgi:putative ABC transport system substrate-binding protein
MTLRRRDFITLVGSAAAWPLAARAQQPAIPVIGWLDGVPLEQRRDVLAAFREGLNEVGFAEGRNVSIEFRFADGQLDRLPELAADLVRRRVAVIVANNQATPAAKAATSAIPIVFITGGDPVKDALVTSLNRPSANLTGVSYTASPLNPKRLELLQELVPKPTAIAVLLDASTATFETQLQDTEAAARALGRQILIVKAGTERELDAAFTTIVQSRAGALFVGAGPFHATQRRQLIALAARHALPASYEGRQFVELGGLMSYGASQTDAYRRGGIYLGRILKGEKPTDLPVELPTKYELVINLATAKALKLDIPAKLLAIADEVIE